MSEFAAAINMTALNVEARAAAFEEIYSQYFPMIYRYVCRLIGRSDQAADIVQESFLRLYGQLQAKDTPDNPKAWLYAVATRLSYNQLKRNRTFQTVLRDWLRLNEWSGSAEADYWQKEKRELIRRALNRLPARDQVLIQLFQDGLSYAEIAEAADINATSVGKLLSRAIDRCAALIER